MKLEMTYLTPSMAAQVFTNAEKTEKNYDNKHTVWNIIYYIKQNLYHLYHHFVSLSDKNLTCNIILSVLPHTNTTSKK